MFLGSQLLFAHPFLTKCFLADKPVDAKANFPRESSIKEGTPPVPSGSNLRQLDGERENPDTKVNMVADKSERAEPKLLDGNTGSERMSPVIPAAAQAKGRSSKTSTPVVSTFPESQTRGRSSRNNGEAASKRAHKKSASVSTTYKPRPPARDEESSHEGDDEDDESEPRYCYCNQVSFGEMVACDNDSCPTEWFHLSCVGLTKPPGRNGKLSFFLLAMSFANFCQ